MSRWKPRIGDRYYALLSGYPRRPNEFWPVVVAATVEINGTPSVIVVKELDPTYCILLRAATMAGADGNGCDWWYCTHKLRPLKTPLVAVRTDGQP